MRWRAPVDPQPWKEKKLCKTFARPAIQLGSLFGPGANNCSDDTIAATLNTPVGEEDCLYLNIWRPSTNETNLPVLVFIHGGGFTAGYTADPLYNGANLARVANAVVVTCNYRLSLFGFFNLKQLYAEDLSEDVSGNFGFLDNIQALKFVHENIKAFGGDPSNVTVMGEFAGGILTWAMVASPLAKGLVHKAIPISGGLTISHDMPYRFAPALFPGKVYRKQTEQLLYALLMEDKTVFSKSCAKKYVASKSQNEIMDYLRAKDARTILEVAYKNQIRQFGLYPDGIVLPLHPVKEMESGNYNPMPVMVGVASEEGKLMSELLTTIGLPKGITLSASKLYQLMQSFDPESPETVKLENVIHRLYMPVNKRLLGWNHITNFITKQFWKNRDRMLRALDKQQREIWAYEFAWDENPGAWKTIYGASHAFNLPFEFGNFTSSLLSPIINSKANEPGRLALSEAMMRIIAAFIRTGNPNHQSLGDSWAKKTHVQE